MRKLLGTPPRNMTNGPDWEEARKLENGEWRLEPEGEAEVLEIIIVSDVVEGTPVDLEGESRHEQVEAKLSRREREMLNEGGDQKSEKRSNSGGIRRNTRLCERRKDYGIRGSETEDLHTECGGLSAKAFVSL